MKRYYINVSCIFVVWQVWILYYQDGENNISKYMTIVRIARWYPHLLLTYLSIKLVNGTIWIIPFFKVRFYDRKVDKDHTCGWQATLGARMGDKRHERASRGDERHQRARTGDKRHQEARRGDKRHQRASRGDEKHQRARTGDKRHQGARRGDKRHQRASMDDKRHQRARTGGKRCQGQKGWQEPLGVEDDEPQGLVGGVTRDTGGRLAGGWWATGVGRRGGQETVGAGEMTRTTKDGTGKMTGDTRERGGWQETHQKGLVMSYQRT